MAVRDRLLLDPAPLLGASLLIAGDTQTGTLMLPVVRGERATRRQIAGYALLLVAISLDPVATGSPARSTSSPPSWARSSWDWR